MRETDSFCEWVFSSSPHLGSLIATRKLADNWEGKWHVNVSRPRLHTPQSHSALILTINRSFVRHRIQLLHTTITFWLLANHLEFLMTSPQVIFVTNMPSSSKYVSKIHWRIRVLSHSWRFRVLPSSLQLQLRCVLLPGNCGLFSTVNRYFVYNLHEQSPTRQNLHRGQYLVSLYSPHNRKPTQHYA